MQFIISQDVHHKLLHLSIFEVLTFVELGIAFQRQMQVVLCAAELVVWQVQINVLLACF